MPIDQIDPQDVKTMRDQTHPFVLLDVREPMELEIAAVGMGNPHAIVPVDSLDPIPFENWGSGLEVHEAFPAKTNVHFLKVHSPSHLEIRVWERGAGPTLACGTGACATLVAAVLLGLSDRNATVVLPGGPLEISWPEPEGSVFMTGPADAVFDGVLNPELVPADADSTEDPFAADSVPAPVAIASSDAGVSSEQVDSLTEAEAQAKVQEFLNSTSLDSMINIAAESLEQRTLSRIQRDGQS